MKVVFAHICYQDQTEAWHRAVALAAPAPLEVKPLALSLPGRPGRISWAELDLRWRHRDRDLLRLYARVAAACEDADVLWNYNGAMLHPDFVRTLSCRTVYSCFDDPEDFPDLAAPVADAYDYALYGNAASGPLFSDCFAKSDWLPIFTDSGEFDRATATPDYDRRDIDLVFAGGISGYSDYRRRRLLHLAEAFPQAVCVGRGWPGGYAGRSTIEDLYQRARVGWNIHRTTGPINQRLFDLARFGVAQVCDNAPQLGRVFELEKEILGFGTVEEAVTQIQRLLDDDSLRRSLATAARCRYERDYTATHIWSRFANLIASRLPSAPRRASRPVIPAPAWPGYLQRARVERLVNSVRSGWHAALATWRSKPDYLTWSFDETACLPAVSVPTASDARSDVPPTVLAALAVLLPQGTHVTTDSEQLAALVEENPFGIGLSGPNGSGANVHLSLTGVAATVAAVLSPRDGCCTAGYVIARGDAATLDAVFRSQARHAAGDRASALSFRTCVVPRDLVPWAEVLNSSHAGTPRWCLFEITRLAGCES